jgi:serine/threonine-protein kinase
MSFGRDALGASEFASLDGPGLVELCTSLADYGEAGGLSRDLMLRVGSFAEANFAHDVEVMLAASRMYLLGGETERSLSALIGAGRRWPDEDRVRPLLAHALRLLEDPRTVEEALADGPSSAERRPKQPEPKPDGARPRTQPERIVPKRAATPPGLPMLKRPDAEKKRDTAPMSEAQRLRALGESSADTVPVMRRVRASEHPPIAPTPASGLPRVPRAPAMPRGLGEVASASTRAARLHAEARGAVAVRVEPAVIHEADVRTEVGRRLIDLDLGQNDAGQADPAPSSPLRPMGGVPRTTRIRLLDPDDERRLLDPYELIGELASGGMATVFLGRLAGAGGFQRLVAIKRLHPHLAREDQFVKMFLDEARIAASIHHPHVVPILEVGMNDAGYYLVMEFIEGDTLAGLIVRSLQRGSAMPSKVAARIVLDALAGLHAAHQLADGDKYLGLVHRDCTPQNILVGIDGSARVTDFGVARAAARLTITRPQQVKGKVGYLSPEQAHALELDRRSDIFTMGIVLWEALAGRPLFQGETEAATLSKLLSGQVPSLHAFAPDVPAALDDVCRRALAHDRNRRFRTAAEMAEALERAVNTDGFGGAASPRELGRFVESVMGAEIVAQREAVRAWLAQHEGTAPLSRGPRSITSSGGAPRGPATPRSGSIPPPTPPAAGAPPSEDPPETPAPVAEKVPRLASTPPPLPVEREPEPAAEPPAVEKTAPSEPSVVAREEEEPASEPEEEPAAAEPEAPAPKPQALADRVRAQMPPWLHRLATMKLSTGRGIVLVAVLVLVAIAPLAYKLVKQRSRGARPAATQTARTPGAKAPPKAAAPQPSNGPAWDEWPVPEGGAPAADEQEQKAEP